MYMRKIRMDHRLIFMMVVLLAPGRFRDMPPPDLRGFKILHVEYLMDVQVVGMMVPRRLVLVLTWVGA